MSFLARLQRGREILEQHRRLSVRALGRELLVAGEELEEIVEELVDVQQVARRDGKVLLWVATPSEAGAHHAGATPSFAGARKVVTVVFADLLGSTALHERIDPESARRVMEAYYAALRAAVEAHGGTVVKLLGDGVMAAFGVPNVGEDDAIRAVRAGVAMQEAFRALVAERGAALGDVGLRVAINTGEVVVSGSNDDVVGDPVNVAARLQQEARDGDVVLGEATRRLVESLATLEPLGSFALKGRTEAVAAHRVVSLDAPGGASTAPFVGRADELARLTAVYDEAVATPAARLAVLLGSPGLGKSRLIAELARRRGDAATVVAARCDAAGRATFAPLADALRERLGLDSGASPDVVRQSIEALLPDDADDRARIAGGVAALIGGAPAAPEETFFVVRRFLAGLAAARPVVLVIDDLQWAGPLLLDLVEHLVQWGGGVRLLVLVGARPELRDLRSSLATSGGLVADVVTLGGLDAGAAMRLAANVIGADDLPAAVAVKVLATSEGNPLFVGELVRMLVHEGALTREGDRWTVGSALATLEMPPTIHALLAARIERLRPEERTVLERAAVVGRHFSRRAVAELLPSDAVDLNARLEALRRSELIERDTGWLLGEPILRFHHVLIRDAAYRRLLKETRAELHERLAAWIERRVGDAIEHDETIGRHLEQAHHYLGELGPLDAKGRALGQRAATRLAAAGRGALARDDVSVAGDLLGRAVECLPAEDPARAELTLDWCEALLAEGNVAAATPAIDALARAIEGPDPDRRLRAWHTCFTGQLTAMTAPQELQAAVDAVARAAEEFSQLGDVTGEAKAHSVQAQALARLGKVGACEAALDKALAAARKVGDRRRANAVLAGAPLAALWGPSPVTRASGRCLDVVRVLRITQGAPAVEAVALSCQGVLEALRGRVDAARRMIDSARTMVEELGIAHRLHEVDAFASRVDLLEGNVQAAERSLRRAYDGLRTLGLGIDAARAGALLARALLARGEVEEAERLSRESEELAGDDLQAAIAWRGVRAQALARRGEHAGAIALAKAGVDIAAATDALLDHADARLALAATLRAAARNAEADAEERHAVELWRTKGATMLAERAGSPDRTVTPVPGPRAARPVAGRRVAPPVVAYAERVEAAFRARDVAAIEAMLAHHQDRIDHTTGAVYGSDGLVASVRSLLRAQEPCLRAEPLASLGDRLALIRERSSAGGTTGGCFDVAAYEREQIILNETDDRGRLVRSECFAADHLSNAITRLYERYAELLPEGPERDRALATARTVAVFVGPADPTRLATVGARTMRVEDHRVFGTWASHGGVDLVEHFRGQLELAPDFADRVEELAAAPHALLLRRRWTGTMPDGGGTFENFVCEVISFGADGLLAQGDVFEGEQIAEALARFDELTADPPPTARITNAAARTFGRAFDALQAQDWEGFAALFAPGFRGIDRRKTLRNELDRDEWLASYRQIVEMTSSLSTNEVLATRGDRLVLARYGWMGTDGLVGLSEIDYLLVIEVDDRGDHVAVVMFDPDDLDGAYAELDRRFDADEGATLGGLTRRVTEAFAERDWDGLAALCSPALVEHDHRPLISIGTTHGREAWVHRTVRSWIDLAPDVVLRFDHVRRGARGILYQSRLEGTGDGGRFEIVNLGTAELDGRGLVERIDVYEPSQIDQARARFGELAGGTIPTPSHFANTALRVAERITALWMAKDWEGIAHALPARFRYVDHRRATLLDLDRTRYLEFIRLLGDMESTRIEHEWAATRGERLALTRMRIDVAGGDVGPSEIEMLSVFEVDEHGDPIALVHFEPDDLAAAYAELDARWEAGEAAAHPAFVLAYQRAIASRDWAPVLARMCGPTFVEYDHRRLAVLGTTRGAEAWVRNFRTLTDLAPDSIYRIEHFRSAARGFWCVGTWHGSREGGPYELPINAVIEMDERNLVSRADIYDLDQVEQAAARFAELAGPPDALARLAKPNAAHAAMQRWVAAYEHAAESGDWTPMDELWGAGFVWEDRRRLFRLSGGIELFTAAARERVAIGARPRFDLVGTAGERIAIHRILWSGGPPEGPFEMEYVDLFEVDDCGRITTIVLFDADDTVATRREAWRRWAAIDPSVAEMLALVPRMEDAFNAQDAEALRATAREDLQFVDRRRTGMGTLDRHGYVESAVRLWKLAPATRLELGWFWPAIAPGGWVFSVRRTGDDAYESVYLALVLHADGRVTRLEFLEIADLESARARLGALCPGSTRAPASPRTQSWVNSASRARDRLIATMHQRDWLAFAEMLPAEFRFEDRRSHMHLDLGRERYVEFVRSLGDLESTEIQSALLATRGDRLVLSRYRLNVAGGDVGPTEMEYLTLLEVDERGRPVAAVRFDAIDLEAACADLDARYVAGEGKDDVFVGWARKYGAALMRRDWDAVAACYTSTCAVYDHRMVGFGTHGQADLVHVLRAMFDLAPDARQRPQHIRTSNRIYIAEILWTGTRDGGAFESAFVAVGKLDAEDRIENLDLYDPHHLERAFDRFREIARTEPVGRSARAVTPLFRQTAATAWIERFYGMFDRQDWDAARAACARGFTWEDRRPIVGLSGDVELMIASARERIASGARHERRGVVGTAGDRVVVTRVLWAGGPSDGRFEVEFLVVSEIDEDGRCAAAIFFAPDDPRAAQREAWRRWAAIDPSVAEMLAVVSRMMDVVNTHDVEGMRATAGEDFQMADNRRTGMGELDFDAYLASLRALWGLASTNQTEVGWHWLVSGPQGGVTVARRHGELKDGGPCESEFLLLVVQARGRITHMEWFETDDVEAALARFDELRSGGGAER